jgi:hypothetical protein
MRTPCQLLESTAHANAYTPTQAVAADTRFTAALSMGGTAGPGGALARPTAATAQGILRDKSNTSPWLTDASLGNAMASMAGSSGQQHAHAAGFFAEGDGHAHEGYGGGGAGAQRVWGGRMSPGCGGSGELGRLGGRTEPRAGGRSRDSTPTRREVGRSGGGGGGQSASRGDSGSPDRHATRLTRERRARGAAARGEDRGGRSALPHAASNAEEEDDDERHARGGDADGRWVWEREREGGGRCSDEASEPETETSAAPSEASRRVAGSGGGGRSSRHSTPPRRPAATRPGLPTVYERDSDGDGGAHARSGPAAAQRAVSHGAAAAASPDTFALLADIQVGLARCRSTRSHVSSDTIK